MGGKQQLSFDPTGRLFFGDNLEVMRRHIADASVDLIYLDPPFNSNRSYNLLFEHRDGRKAAGQVKAFDDTWSWSMESARTFEEVVRQGSEVSRSLRAMREILGTNDMLAYLTMMAPRLTEMHRALKSTGSLYLHCDPSASHYLKVLLDAVFGAANFRNEIVWKRTNARSASRKWPRVHDVILFYGKTSNATFVPEVVEADVAKMPHTLVTGADGKKYQSYELTGAGTRNGETGKPWRGFDPNAMGRHWANRHAALDEWDAAGLIHWPARGGFPRRRDANPYDGKRKITVGDVWTDIDRINQSANEKLGFPTQKPEELLDRIIRASSNKGDVVLDPFCGCGTAIDAAQKLGRSWVGIDITKVAIDVILGRMARGHAALDFTLTGEPSSIDEAAALAELDKFEFQAWACRRVGVANPSRKKGADRGIDGRLLGVFENGETWEAIVQAKGGRITAADVRDLHGTVTRERADFGVFVTLHPPTKAMLRDAADVGFTPEGVPGLQLLSVADVLEGVMPQTPRPSARPRVEEAARSGRSLRAV